MHRIIIVCLNGKSWILLEVVPQRAHQLTNHNIIRVLLDNTQQKHAVLLQVLIQKGIKDLGVNGRVAGSGGRGRMMVVAESLIDLQIAPNERGARGARERVEPDEEAVHGHGRHQHQPEVNDDKDLLVEEVDWQGALDRVDMVILAQVADGEVAHGDAREAWRLPEVIASDNIPDHFEPVQIKVGAHEHIQQKELTARIRDVHQLDKDVQTRDVVSGSVLGQEAAADASPHASDDGVVVVVAVVVDGAVDQLDCVAHGLVPRLGRGRVH